MIKNILATEKEIQEALIQWAKFKRISGTSFLVSDYLIAIPNGGYRDPREGASLKRAGVKPGASDLFFAYPKDDYHGLWLELKSKHGKIGQHQVRFVNLMNKVNFLALFAFGLDDAIFIIENYLKNPHELYTHYLEQKQREYLERRRSTPRSLSTAK